MAEPRSYLFVPADRPERIAKARGCGADAVIVDLEDAVAPGAKSRARDALLATLDAARPVVLRINGRDTPWFDDDARFAMHPGVAAVVCPKASSVDDVAAVRSLCGGKPVLALIETARGMAAVDLIAGAPGVARLVFGSIDFQLDLDIDDDSEEALQPYRAMLVLSARVAGLPAPVDGVSVAIDDAARTAAEARRARATGFGGKLCIHPKQVAAVNTAFSAGEARLAWARRVVEAAGAARGAAVAVDGKMVDAPVLARARRWLSAENSASAAPPPSCRRHSDDD